MVKAKKGKHGGKDDDLDDDVDVASVDSGNLKKRKDSEGSIGKKDKKGHKGKKKGDDDSEDEEIIEKRSKKGKKKNMESDEEEIVDKKSKKGKKKNDESDEEEDVKANKKKSKKEKRKVDDEDEDEIVNLKKKVETVDISSKNKKKKGKNKDDDSENEMSDEAPKKSKGKAKEKPKGGFALLQVEDEGSDNEINMSPERPDTPEESYDKPKSAQDKGGKKGKKNRKKKDEDDDDDIDKVLAELEMEYAGIKPKDGPEQNEEKTSKKPKSKGKGSKKGGDRFDDDLLDDVEVDMDDDEEDGKTVKSAAQKKKEKKLRQLQKKEQRDGSVDSKAEEKEEAKPEPKQKEDEDKKGKKDRKKKGDKDKEKDKDKDKEDDKKAKGPGKKALLAMQETLKKIKEEEERFKREEEERIKREEEAENARLEQLRIEKEKKDKKKQKEKERKERLKAEGKLLTAKQKADKARAQEMIAALRAQGVALPDPGEKKPRPGTRIRANKSKTLVTQDSTDGSESKTEKEATPPEVQVEIVDTKEETKEEVEGIKDTWDAESSGEEDASEKAEPEAEPVKTEVTEENKETKEESEEESESEEEEEDDEDEDEESSDEESGSEDEHKTDAEKKREKALARIEKRKEEAEKNKSLDNLRASVVCVLGHVDTGKTKILDKLRNTHVQDGEAGGITQQIGATNVPIDNIKEACKLVKSFNEMELKIPGLLIIDTPGHESFSNLRSRGSSLCDIAILVVDIMHGLEPQTLESINLLKNKKTPFVVALNKIDRLYDWKTGGRKDIRDILKTQSTDTLAEFNRRTKEVIIQFAEQGLNAALFFENPDLRSYVSLVPTSAITGEGMGNLLALIVEFCQNMLAKRLMYSDLLLATVLEVKAISGLGTTIDCILINGKLAEGDTIILAGTDGPIVTQIRSLLMPQPMKELRVKNAYIEYKEIKAAQGVKIAAKDLEKAIAGLNLQVAQKPDEVPIYCEEVAKELKNALSSIKLKERGVYVQASTLGSLEALLEFLKTSKIPYSGIRIGPVVKKDVMKASIMLEHENQYATILAFDVKIERDAQELADSLGVKIFQANIIYHLFDRFKAYREELLQKKRDEFKSIAVFPCKLRILPHFVFNTRDPIVVGVMVEAGVVKEGTPLCVPSKEFLNVGVVTSVEINHKQIEMARKGQEVCIKIENPPGETPKLYGRHFDHTDLLMSRISRQSIDACKDYFRDDLTKQDWQLMVELKKLFQIL